MPKTAFQLNLKRPPEDAAVKTHNRWHPDIPMVEMFKPGAEFRVECFDWTGGQIFNDDSANDVRADGSGRERGQLGPDPLRVNGTLRAVVPRSNQSDAWQAVIRHTRRDQAGGR